MEKTSKSFALNKYTILGVMCAIALTLELIGIFLYLPLGIMPGALDIMVLIVFPYTIYKTLVKRSEMNKWVTVVAFATVASYLFAFIIQFV